MEKLLRQFAPFVALIVAAALVVIANPGENGNTNVVGTVPGAVAAPAATTSAISPSSAAPVPTDASAPAADVAPFAGASSGGASSSFSSGSSSSSFSSGSSSSGSSFSSPSSSTTPSFSPDSPASSTFAPTTDPPASSAPEPFAAPSSGPSSSDPGTSTDSGSAGSDFYLFEQVPESAACTSGGDAAKPLVLAPAYAQSIVATEPAFPDRASDLTQNKTDPEAERFVYRTHSVITNGAVSVTDLAASPVSSRILSQRADWERLDGVVWTPSSQLLVGENIRVQERPDPSATTAKAGLVYEINPRTGAPTVRPALGAKSHKGMSFDHLGNLYSVSATNPGYVYRFVPTAPNNYSAGTLSALYIGPTGESTWLALPGADVVVDADAAAKAAGATPLLDPEDAKMMIITAPSGAKRSQLFVAETGANRVLTVVLRTTTSGTTAVADSSAYTSTYVAPGLNAPKDFAHPSALIVDTTYNLYIAEHNGGGGAATKTRGDDIWVAPANGSSAIQASPAGRLASVTDCDATPAGLHFDLTGSKLYLNLTGRGGDGRDMTLLITTAGGV